LHELSDLEVPMMWGGMDGVGWGWMGLGMLHVGLFWILVILGIVVLVKWLASGPPSFLPPQSEGRAIDILKARYAKGELTREQFEQMKREIED
jgi:putative membrane protein